MSEPYPRRLSDPRTRRELEEWLKAREERQPGVPLSPREWLMVQAIGRQKPPYAIT